MSADAAIRQLILGESAVMRDIRAIVSRFAPTPFPVLILGPTGSGKGVVAQALHEASGRRGRLVVANVAALGDGLAESELFGHVRGAFTSSTASRRGLLLHADRGTAFLDEIHRLAAPTQPKLLRVLETQLVRPVGADQEIQGDFRIVAAANEDLDMLVDKGRFQTDLVGRLARLRIDVPPLSAHAEDIPELAAHFLEAVRGTRVAELSAAAVKTLQEYDWPRNVRELQAVIERCIVLGESPLISRGDVLAALAIDGRRSPSPARSECEYWHAVPTGVMSRERAVRNAMATDGTVKSAAAVLGVSPPTLYRWLQELGLPTPQRRYHRRRDEIT